MQLDIESLKFPIGKYVPNKQPTQSVLDGWIQDIEQFPSQLSKIIEGMTELEMKWCYRPEGWNIVQLIHHCADSHMNAVIRFKLALTENQPTIKPYQEPLWVELPDSNYLTLDLSLGLLKNLHTKWGVLLRSLSPNDLTKTYVHPEHGQIFNLAETIGNYAWHGKHHLAHINLAFAAKGEFND